MNNLILQRQRLPRKSASCWLKGTRSFCLLFPLPWERPSSWPPQPNPFRMEEQQIELVYKQERKSSISCLVAFLDACALQGWGWAPGLSRDRTCLLKYYSGMVLECALVGICPLGTGFCPCLAGMDSGSWLGALQSPMELTACWSRASLVHLWCCLLCPASCVLPRSIFLASAASAAITLHKTLSQGS